MAKVKRSRKFYSPSFVELPRATTKNRRISINWNKLMALQPVTRGDVKRRYIELMESQFKNVKPVEPPVRLVFTQFKGSARRSDRANALGLTEKFFCDAATHYGLWEDDNDNIIQSSHYKSGPIDRTNPRIEIEVEELCG